MHGNARQCEALLGATTKIAAESLLAAEVNASTCLGSHLKLPRLPRLPGCGGLKLPAK